MLCLDNYSQLKGHLLLEVLPDCSAELTLLLLTLYKNVKALVILYCTQFLTGFFFFLLSSEYLLNVFFEL